VTEAVEAIRGIAKTIGEINQITSGIASAVEEQDATTKDIARNVQQAAAGNERVSQAMVGLKDDATSSMSVAGQLTSAARDWAIRLSPRATRSTASSRTCAPRPDERGGEYTWGRSGSCRTGPSCHGAALATGVRCARRRR
jgi:hypothetical protein